MANGISANNNAEKGSFYSSCQLGSHALNGAQQASIMSKVGYNLNNNHLEVGIGLGGVNTLAFEMGHETIWNKLGLDVSLKGEHNKQLFKNQESKTVQLADDNEIALTNQYRPSDVRLGLGAEATYRPNKGVRLGLGAEAGVVIPTTENNKININNEKVSFKHSHLPEGYVTPKVSAEVDLGKGISLIGNANLYEQRVGIKAQF